ncbi:MAG: phosphodiester glycosidase family protein [Oscillospiraceae bacterium]|nr:phosphodiester glycosidase family protein [Oscillospiraceae bacterium]
MTKKKRSGLWGAIKVLFGFIGLNLLLAVILLLGLIWVMEKGPSPTATAAFCRSVRETSAIKWVADIFLSDEELAAIGSVDPTLAEEQDRVDTTLIRVPEPDSEESEETLPLELIDIHSGNIKGKLLIVHDPKRVIVGTSDNLGKQGGMQLTELVAKYDGVAGINGGGFNDENGRGNGGIPQGMVITDGEVVFGDPNRRHNLIGLTGDGILVIDKMTGQEALDAGLRWAVTFDMDGAISGALIINGTIQTQNLASGVNPRTAIGQRAEDGALLLLVLDGRQIDTLGATLQDVCDVMLEYGATNVGNLDGGSSSVIVYDGEIINNCASITGPRYIPTGFIVLKEGRHG